MSDEKLSTSSADRPRNAVIRKLWGRMAAMYGGSRWASATSALPENEDGSLTLAADTWAEALRGVTEEQIGEGLRACLASNDQYVPTAMLFRQRCLGIPSLAAVRVMLRSKGRISAVPFAQVVWSFIDSWALARADHRMAEAMIADAYDLACEYRMRGGALPEAAAGELPKPKKAPRTRAREETVRAELDAMAEKLK